jgi:hypothetical protein
MSSTEDIDCWLYRRKSLRKLRLGIGTAFSCASRNGAKPVLTALQCCHRAIYSYRTADGKQSGRVSFIPIGNIPMILRDHQMIS